VTSERAEVVVVGMGSAGAAAALFLARAGRRVIAIDKRPAGETGARWVNAVPRWCFERAGVEAPSGEALFGGHGPAPDHAFHLVAPGGVARLTLPTPPVLHVDMRRLVDRLVRDARDAGVELVQGSVADVELEAGRVAGVRVETDAGPRRLAARLVVDASGIGGAVRRRVPALAAACPDPAAADRCVAAEFHYAVRDPAGLEAFLRANGARPGHDLAFPGVAGGFSTLTVFTTRALDQVGVLTGSIPASGVADGGDLLARFVESAPWLGERLWGGRGAIPVRRPYERLVDAGVALIGDAACQVHAAHGSGVGIGLLAARALARAVEGSDDPGALEALAAYERSFHREHGGLLAAADAFRRFVQQASRDDLAALLATGLLDERLASAALAQEPTRPDLRFALSMLPRAARAPGLSLRFLPLAARSAVLDRLGGLGGVPRVGRSLARALAPLVGPTPASAGRGPWSIPDGGAPGGGGGEREARP
jgi:flavin-dependent dehydrogenase